MKVIDVMTTPIERVLAEIKMWHPDDQVTIMRSIADDNGYEVVSGYSITGKLDIASRLDRLEAAVLELNPGLNWPR